MRAGDAIDLQKHPIDRAEGEAYGALLDRVQADLAAEGCAVLRGFIKPAALAAFIQEADQVADRAHRSHSETNVYFSKPDDAFPDAHPVNRFYARSNAFVPADNFPTNGPLRSIYQWPAFMPFIREALGEPPDRFFRYDDPLADVIVNVVEEGEGFPWHFDTNNYTVTLAIQNAETGGHFEYCPNLRSAEDENYNGVAAVLDGEAAHVRSLALQPGDLQIFKGRYALHRVAATRGDTPRYVGIFSFVEKEGMCGGVERTRQLYGRVLARHHERAGWRDDALRD